LKINSILKWQKITQMTLRLILTRHAKSSWDNLTVKDHDRALNARGYASAKAVGAWISKHGYCPKMVFSPTSRRTTETWAEIARFCNGSPEVQFTSALYLASPDRMLTILKGCRQDTVMLLGHNPGTAILAQALVRQEPEHAKFDKYPCAATTVIDFEAESWADIKMQSGKVIDFVVPRDLIT
jgi:phosphohistidine phosphatase